MTAIFTKCLFLAHFASFSLNSNCIYSRPKPSVDNGFGVFTLLARIAQLAEQLICNQQVTRSIRVAGSSLFLFLVVSLYNKRQQGQGIAIIAVNFIQTKTSRIKVNNKTGFRRSGNGKNPR